MPIFSPQRAPEPPPDRCTAFVGGRLLQQGSLLEVAQAAKEYLKTESAKSVTVFDDETGRMVEIDYRGSIEAVLARLRQQQRQAATPLPPETTRRPGRPKLGVVAREVTLLPRHWDWLSRQPGGASVALRKLVEEARKAARSRDRRRGSQEAAHRFLQAVGGDRPGFEEATRALFAGDAPAFAAHLAPWPADLRAHAQRLAADALTPRTDPAD